MPYTYLIKFKPTGQVYYGVKYASRCNPDDLWIIYFTSSKYIKQLIKTYGLTALNTKSDKYSKHPPKR